MYPPLQAIVDVDTAERLGWAPPDLADAYLAGGARFIQVRAKRLASGALLRLCDRVVERARQHGAIVVVNDRPDIASMAGADGVHVGQGDVPAQTARAMLGDDRMVGLSTHDVRQIADAVAQPVSYIAVGPVFGTSSKETGYTAVGRSLVTDAARLAGRRPIVAIGGITLENAATVIAAGATTVAVIGDLLAGGDPAARVARYIEVLTR